MEFAERRPRWQRYALGELGNIPPAFLFSRSCSIFGLTESAEPQTKNNIDWVAEYWLQLVDALSPGCAHHSTAHRGGLLDRALDG